MLLCYVECQQLNYDVEVKLIYGTALCFMNQITGVWASNSEQCIGEISFLKEMIHISGSLE